VNNDGVAGALRRDEDDVVDSTDLFAQAEWRFAERWSVHGGVRASRVEFRVSDYFIDGVNPDDSGSRVYSATTPVLGIVFRPTKLVSVYGNAGRGFETPTFAELAHRNAGAGSGPNFALEPAKSRHAEIGTKAVLPRLARINAAVFDVEVTDEIVVDASNQGRATFRNAGRTERRGLELAAETLLEGPWDAQLAFTRLDATFEDGTNAGNVLPGVPRTQAYGSLRYRRDSYYVQLEAIRRSRVAVNDANAQFADAYPVASLVAGLVQRGERWRLTQFVRVDNLADRNYAGSVIVNEGMSRFYEPAPGRNYLVGAQASLQF
ncbi:MAG: TonB-dependent receptor domain-containing protein, partial [Myxococcota bacterium]